MASPDPTARRAALDEYRRTIDAAQRLGCRWVRPAPRGQRPDLKLLAASYRELIDYAGPKGISLLVENNGWMRGDPDAIPAIVAAVGRGTRGGPGHRQLDRRRRATRPGEGLSPGGHLRLQGPAAGPDGEHSPTT